MHPWPPGGAPWPGHAVLLLELYIVLLSTQPARRPNKKKRWSNDDCMVEILKVIDANRGCKCDIRRKRCSSRGEGLALIGPPDDRKNALILREAVGLPDIT
jgi:hypothetical protein